MLSHIQSGKKSDNMVKKGYTYSKNKELEEKIITVLIDNAPLTAQKISEHLNLIWTRRTVSYQLQKLRVDKRVIAKKINGDMKSIFYTLNEEKHDSNLNVSQM